MVYTGAAMMGFVLLTHERPEQIQRLVARLNTLYGNPPIACHHDTRQSPPPALPENAELVPPVETRWGDFSLITATLRALEALWRRNTGVEWVTLLSGTDYPVAPPDRVFATLQAGGDAFLEVRRVDANAGDWWSRDRAGRYLGTRVWLGHLVGKLRKRPVRSVGPRRLGSIFGHDFHCYAGSQWFTLNRSAWRAVLDGPNRFPQLTRRYRMVFCPDESYVHTVLGNTAGIQLRSELHRFQIWDPAPIALRREHVPAIAASDAWFARKVDGSDPALVAALDELSGACARSRLAD